MKVANANIDIGDDFVSECNSCPSNGGCSKDKENCMVKNNPYNNVKKIIGVMSEQGSESTDESLKKIFNPIVTNIINSLEEKR